MTFFSPKISAILVFALVVVLAAISGCTGVSPAGSSGGNGAGELRFMTEEIYPYSYTLPNGTLGGSSVVVVRELLQRTGIRARVESRPWNVSYTAALAEPGTAVFPTARTPEREHLFLWVGPIGTFEYILYARNSTGVALQSLEAARAAGMIAVVEGDARHSFLLAHNFSNVRTFPTDAECLAALREGSVELWLGSSTSGMGKDTPASPGTGDVVPVYPLAKFGLYIAFHNATDPTLVKTFQDALDSMKADGTFDRIMAASAAESKTRILPGSPANPLAGLALHSLSALIGERMNGIGSALNAIAVSTDARSGEWERVRPVLLRLESDHAGTRFWFARADGSYYTTVDNLTTMNLRDRPYFPDVLAGKTSVGTVVMSRTTGRPSTIIAVPVAVNGTVTNLLGASVSCDDLRLALEEAVPLPGGYFFFALAQDGSVVFDSLPDLIFSLADDPATRDTILSAGAGECSFRYAGMDYRAVFTTERATGWRVAVAWRE